MKLTAAVIVAIVTGVSDGDTLTVLHERQQVKIRLAEIDAPEKSQPFGARSKQSLSELCFGKSAEVLPQTRDRYGRTVALVRCDGVGANAEQVRRGMAWVYRAYSRDPSMLEIENEARAAGRGLWSDATATPPWAWRKARR